MGARVSRFSLPLHPRNDRSQGPVFVATFLLFAIVWAMLFLGNVWGPTSTGSHSAAILPINGGAAATRGLTRSAPAAATPPGPKDHWASAVVQP